MSCMKCHRKAVVNLIEPSLAWCQCGWNSPAMYQMAGRHDWLIKYAEISLEIARLAADAGGTPA